VSLERKLHSCATGETRQTAVFAGTSAELYVRVGIASTTDAGTDSPRTDPGSPSDAEDSSTDGGVA
jgi:hypothetical protein